MDQEKYTFIFMGVSGSGKSAVAECVSRKMNATFLDGDILHTRSNIDKMTVGEPLNDSDRLPWLEALNTAIYAMQHTHKVSILVCSALKEAYRNILRRDNEGIFFIYLKGDFDLILKRLESREGHFFKPEMLKSQFDILEEPTNEYCDVCIVDIRQTFEKVVEASLQFIDSILHPTTTKNSTFFQ